MLKSVPQMLTKQYKDNLRGFVNIKAQNLQPT
jgi:hypothetical protein